MIAQTKLTIVFQGLGDKRKLERVLYVPDQADNGFTLINEDDQITLEGRVTVVNEGVRFTAQVSTKNEQNYYVLRYEPKFIMRWDNEACLIAGNETDDECFALRVTASKH